MRPEKLEVIRLLVEQSAEEKILSLVQPGASYPVFSPHDATEAAAAMLQYLEEYGVRPNSTSATSVP